MLKLKSLKFKGIGRFVEEQTIAFDVLGKLVQLGGQNNNTGGSSGAGKSTVFMALDYLFGVSNKPSTVLKSRLTDEGIFVEGVFDLDGKPLIISRAKKLSITLDGVVTVGSSSKTEEELDRIIGMDRQLFRKLLHKRQKEGGFFLKMTPMEVNDFLTSALNHGTIKVKIEIVEKELKKLYDRKLTLATALSSSESALKATKDAAKSLGEAPTKDIHQEVVLELKDKSKKSLTIFSTVVAEIKLKEDALDASRPNAVSVPFDRSIIERLEGICKESEKGIKAIQDAESSRLGKAQAAAFERKREYDVYCRVAAKAEESKKKAIEVAEQIKKIRDGKCYTCGHDWVDSQTEANLIKSVKILREDIENGKTAALKIPEIEPLLVRDQEECAPRKVDCDDLMIKLQSTGLELVSERQKEKDHQWEEYKKNKTLMDEFDNMRKSSQEINSRRIEVARGQADIDRRAFEAALSKLKAYEEARTRFETTQASLKAQEEAYSQKVTDLSAETLKVNTQTDMAEELKRGLKSYLSCSFDEALETISETATGMIRNVPNMANATIQLQGTKETQGGKIKEEVTAVMHLDGDQNVDLRSLCGGEETATDLAIDLAVIDLLENKVNKGIDIFILDEPFNGLDTVCIEAALEVLKNSNSNKRLIIVDHNPEVKEMVESKLLVVRDGTTSSIVQG